jgi:hypothetical protein
MRRLFIPAVVALALAAAACSPWRQDAAAKVDGTEIGASALERDARTLLTEPDLAAAYLGSTATAGTTATAERVPTAALSALLSRRVSEVLVGQELADRGIEVTDADRAQMLTDTRDRLANQEQQSAQSGQPASLLGPFDRLPQALRDRLVAADAASAKLRAALADKELEGFAPDPQAWYQAHQALFVQYCLSTIPVKDASEGAQLAGQANASNLQQLVAGHGGQDAGCGYGYQVQQSFDSDLAGAILGADAGRAVGPFQANDGSLVLVGIRSRDQKSYDVVKAAADALYQQDRNSVEDGPWKTWLAAQKPEVSVDPRYGTWDAQKLQVNPPAGPASPGSAPQQAGGSVPAPGAAG